MLLHLLILIQWLESKSTGSKKEEESDKENGLFKWRQQWFSYIIYYIQGTLYIAER